MCLGVCCLGIDLVMFGLLGWCLVFGVDIVGVGGCY